MSLFINGLPAASMTVRVPWSGVWTADIKVTGDITPSGKAAITLVGEGTSLFVATVDAEHSGEFVERRSVKVLGGGGGWGKTVRAQHYHSDVAINLAQIVSTTAAEVGEVGVTLVPTFVGSDFARHAGPASQIFQDVDWWVGFDGVTKVGIRLPAPPPASLLIKDWDPVSGTASFTCDVVPEPGMLVVDLRFGASAKMVREVEADVSEGSVTGTLWLGEGPANVGTQSEIASELAALAISATRIRSARYYEYRVIAMQGDRAMLQAVDRSAGAPDLLPASVWAGISGYKATLRPASRCLVGFVDGDPRKPFVAFYEPPEGNGWRPVKLELDAVAQVAIGDLALLVTLGGPAGLPVARAPAITTYATALRTAIQAAASAATGTGATPVTGAALGTILGGIATALGAANTALAIACPSPKVKAQ